MTHAPRALSPSDRTLKPPVAISAALMTAAILVVDFTIGPLYDIGTLYVIPTLVLAVSAPPRAALYGALVGSLLILVRLVPIPRSDLTAAVYGERVVALLVLWTTATMTVRLRETTSRLRASTRDLADVKHALDQAAIVATTNAKGTITYANDKFCEISKYAREELLGQDHRILNSGYHSKEFMRDLWTTIASGRIWRGEIRNRAKDGSIYWVDTTIVPFLDERRKPYQYMAIRYDITDRKRSEELLREQAALTRLGRMAAVVAHEVKNPIAGIRGALQIITARMPPEQRDRAVMADIIARLDALNGIVEDLLLYARPRPVKREPVDLHRLIDEIGEMLKRDPTLEEVAVETTGPAISVIGDTEQLRIVFQNLLMNAAQAMGGRGRIEVTLGADNGGARIVVRDHGPGMPPEVIAKAFDPFFTTRHRGTGLGLAIARRIVDAHGGEIAIDSADAGGAAVSIRLPANGVT